MMQLDTLGGESAIADQIEATLGQWDLTTDSPARRQAALVILGRSANQVTDFEMFLDGAASMAARTLGLDSFGVARYGGADEALSFRYCKLAGAEPSSHLLSTFPRQSSAAFAMHSAEPVVFANLTEETRFEDTQLLRQGVGAGIVASLGNSSRYLGSLGVFCDEPRSFAHEDALFVESVAQLLGASLARQQAETALEDREKYHSAAMDTMDSLVIGLSPQGTIQHFNQACKDVTGFALAEVKDRPMWNAFLVPEEVGLVKAALDRLRGGSSIEKIESFLLTKHGVRRRIGWSFSVLRGPDDEIDSLIGTGIDLTGQFEAVENLQRAEADAEHARRMLKDLKTQIENGDLAVVGKNERLLPDDEAEDDSPPDRRVDRRRAYPYVQILAPIVGDRLPSLNEFHEVRCRDISLRGFSFYYPDPPTHEKYVAAFGAHPNQIYLVCKVIHTSSAILDGKEMVLVGCNYLARAEYS